MRARDAAAYIGVSKSTFYRMIRDGELPRPLRIGVGMTAYRVVWLEEFIDRMNPEDRAGA